MADNENEGQEKPFDPTPQRIQQAREKGDLVQSRDLAIAAAYAGFIAALGLGGAFMARHLGNTLLPFLDHPDLLLAGARGGTDLFAALTLQAGIAAAPVLLLPALAVVAVLVAQQAVVFAPSKLAPKLSRLAPVSNAKQKYGPQGLAEFVKSTAKLALVCAVMWFAVAPRAGDLLATAGLPATRLPALLAGEAGRFLLWIMAGTAAIAALDWFWQRHQLHKRLMMSLEELKKESKESEGDPFMKQARRRKAEAIATNRMLADVPQATVVITNPTHYAVALKWDRLSPGAPVCVAKGTDHVARAIRQKAAESGVPVREAPPLARALHATVEVGAEIAPDHYRAVAAIIIWAEKLRSAPDTPSAGDTP